MNRPSALIGLVLVLVGAVWVGQGLGWIGGSAMTGSSFWLVVGIVVAAVGAGLIALALRRRDP